MKLKLSLVIIFLIALVIHENHAGVVLKKFKPRRVIMADLEKDSKVNSSISTKTAFKSHEKDNVGKKTSKTSIGREMNGGVKNVSTIKNSTDIMNETVVKFKTNGSEKRLNSSVVYQTTNDAVSNPAFRNSRAISNSSKNLSAENSVKKDSNTKDSNCSKSKLSVSDVKEKDHICSTIPISKISNISSEISKTLLEENSSHPVLSDVKSSTVNETVMRKQESEADFVAVPDNHTAVHLNNSMKEETPIQESKNPKDLLGEQPKNIIEEQNLVSPDKSVSNVSEQLNNVSAHSNPINIPLTEKLVDDKSDSLVSNASHGTSNSVVNNTEMELVHKTEEKLDLEIRQQENNEKITPFTNTIIKSVGPSDSDVSFTNETLLNQTEMGLESIVSAGLDFLASSEVAKNAAIAMEIFNLSSDSSLTDHIIDDPDMHSVIDLVLPSLPTKDDPNLQSQNAQVEDKNEQDLALSDKMNEHDKKNNTHESTELADVPAIVHPKDKKKCPAPGICVFWFMARNTCTSDGQCEAPKLCCRVRCSKQCIDV